MLVEAECIYMWFRDVVSHNISCVESALNFQATTVRLKILFYIIAFLNEYFWAYKRQL
jgi:hypothetical protein